MTERYQKQRRSRGSEFFHLVRLIIGHRICYFWLLFECIGRSLLWNWFPEPYLERCESIKAVMRCEIRSPINSCINYLVFGIFVFAKTYRNQRVAPGARRFALLFRLVNRPATARALCWNASLNWKNSSYSARKTSRSPLSALTSQSKLCMFRLSKLPADDSGITWARDLLACASLSPEPKLIEM